MYHIDVPGFSLEKTYDSDPFLRWIRLAPNKYIITSGERSVVASQMGMKITLWCLDETFYDFWYSYFHMDVDYVGINHDIARKKVIKTQAVRASGIHMIGSDPYEVLLACAATAGKLDTRRALDQFAAMYGLRHETQIINIGKCVWYTLPSAQRILRQHRKRQCHDPKVVAIAEKVLEIDLPHRNDLILLGRRGVHDLMGSIGIGGNTADTLCNSSLQMMDVFPNTVANADIFERTMAYDSTTLFEWSEVLNRYAGLLWRYAVWNYVNPIKEAFAWA